LGLSTLPAGSKHPLANCPFCGQTLTLIWWQRILIVALGLLMVFIVPAVLGIREILRLLFAGAAIEFLFLRPVLRLLFRIVQPRYVKRSDTVTTLFSRKQSPISR
jgi:hypothetical protein